AHADRRHPRGTRARAGRRERSERDGDDPRQRHRRAARAVRRLLLLRDLPRLRRRGPCRRAPADERGRGRAARHLRPSRGEQPPRLSARPRRRPRRHARNDRAGRL
ncbi:MAG: Ferredoxin, 2Fe-2S, partial [uncultured Sphingomonadaceae bacterium]